MDTSIPPNVLAWRYATPEMKEVWSPTNKTRQLRRLWVADLKNRKQLGTEYPPGTIEAYEDQIENIDLDSIEVFERKLKHDVMANIAEFNRVSGGLQHIHRGLTSRDETDNVEQLQILQSLNLVSNRAVAVLARLARRAQEFIFVDMCGRSHLVPGQAITLGKRFSNIAQELLITYDDLEVFLARYPLRGVKGPMGTQQDLVEQLGSSEKAQEYEEMLRKSLGFPRMLTSVGQVYPRVLDFMAISRLTALASAMGNFSTMIRLMAGLELAHEGFKGEQAGSSAMPHKVNSRTCERIRGLLVVLRGYLSMVSELLGDQWFEGDVSCSVVRRVALPDAFYTIDGLMEATMHVLDEMEVFPHMIEAELKRFQPFLATTALLTDATKRGIGREDAHKIIKAAAMAAVKDMREGQSNLFLSYLSDSGKFPMGRSETITARIDHGQSVEQVQKIWEEVDAIVAVKPEAASYEPRELL